MVGTKLNPPGLGQAGIGVLDYCLGGSGHLVGIFVHLHRGTRYPHPVLCKSRMNFVHPFVAIGLNYSTFGIEIRLAGHLLGILA